MCTAVEAFDVLVAEVDLDDVAVRVAQGDHVGVRRGHDAAERVRQLLELEIDSRTPLSPVRVTARATRAHARCQLDC